jgi:hypothetical protein
MKKLDFVRWRLTANGIEWFWNHHWYPVDGEAQTLNLFNAIDKIVSTYPKGVL